MAGMLHGPEYLNEDISFKEIYLHIKSLQPNCLIPDMNADKYPSNMLFYSDIKHYEQGAG